MSDGSSLSSVPGVGERMDDQSVNLRPATPLGRRAFLAGAAGAAAVTAISGSAEAATVPAGASYYEPAGPVRVADTRTYGEYASIAKNFQRISDRVIRIDIRNNPYISLPSDAVAVVVTLTVLYNGQQGWVQAVPAGNTSTVSNVNLEPGDGAVANLATVRLAAGASAVNGKIDVRGSSPYDVIVDVVGVYRSTSQPVRAGRLIFLSKTKRALDHPRVTRRRQSVPINFVPGSATAVVVNLTAAEARGGGYFTAMATGTVKTPNVSNVNFQVGETRAAGAIVKLGKSGGTPSIDVYSSGDARMIVDVTGYITGPDDTSTSDRLADGLFVPVDPNRVMDTRRPADVARTGKARLWPRWTRAFELPTTGGFGARTQMSGVAMNVTLVTAMNYGYVTVLPAQTQLDEVSNLNPTRVGHTVANHVISQASKKGIEMYALCGGDIIADIAGWYTGSPKETTKAAPVDPSPPQAPFNWLLTVSRMGLQNWVIPNIYSGDPVVDSGNTWHWTNTGMIGDVGASIVVFGHRTSKTAPYYYQHNLRAGDPLIIDTPDQRRYTYRFVGETMTSSSATSILNAARSNSGGTTLTLVSCTGTKYVKNDQPLGGIVYRLVSTFVLEGWKDTAPRGNY